MRSRNPLAATGLARPARSAGRGPARPGVRPKRGALRRGFSLVEFTAVLALIAVLAGVVTIGVRRQMTKGKQNAARGEIATIRNAVELFYQSAGRYPTTEEGLAVLARTSSQDPEPILSRVPTDPWGRPYVYLSPGTREPYEVVSLGGDGREGGTGGDADLSSADLRPDAAPAAAAGR